MYFFSEEERKYLLKKLIPSSRESGIAEELRGWNWHCSELSPPHDILLPVWEISDRYCETGRDTYLRHVQKVSVPASEEMVAGRIYHQAMAELYPTAKRLIYKEGMNICAQLSDILMGRLDDALVEAAEQLSQAKCSSYENIGKSVSDNLRKLWSFEVSRIVSSIFSYLSKYKYLSDDSLINHALPFVVEHKLDGKYLGLSRNLSADAINMGGMLICDLKTGQQRDFHRLSATGYALVYESLYEVPINIGCTVYLSFPKNHPTPHIERDFFIIGDEVRQWFIEERDGKQDLIFYERDPGRCPNPGSCRYREICFQQ
ncbi:MAG: type I-A CRISPR-associated protein Cas4/Csa1 [Methanothrix sp.]|jgi:CRISPR-associated protein Csa1|uniref:type I-A CRISPR-associated protein Cas4/Csa1 n=1 Tax=Methanothrix sp. TaxID=90426 RepID=UPI002CD31E1B|nr:type I-A CRISPR-associated protein Cas4/Csa1 [Euryarchaeota archaeon]HON36462.1 type I-A CRISPR-associated protein Cas4/Csa1 [Methanothrix sp.]